MSERIPELFGDLRADPAFAGPGPDAVAAAGRRRRRARYAVGAVVGVGVVVAGAIAVQPDEKPATLRTVEQPVASVAAPPGAVDWKNATLDVPRYGVCTADRLRFRAGTATSGEWKYRMLPYGEPEYGDVTGDGLPDAIVALDCVGRGTGTRVTEYQPAVVAYSGNGRLLGVVAVINPQSTGPRYWIEDGAVVVDANEVNSSAGVRRYRWTGAKFEAS